MNCRDFFLFSSADFTCKSKFCTVPLTQTQTGYMLLKAYVNRFEFFICDLSGVLAHKAPSRI